MATPGPVDALVREGREAYARGDADASRVAFEQAATHGETGVVLEGLARAAHLAGDYAASTDLHQRAYAAYREEKDLLAAARAARTVAWFRGWLYGDWAVFGGWMARARSLLEQCGTETLEHGWVIVADARVGHDLMTQRRQLEEAIGLARRHGDLDLEAEATSYLGVMLAMSGFPAEGVMYMNESLASVCSGEVTDLSVIEGVFCALFSTCERTHDVLRAEEWLRAADGLVRRRKLVSIGGYCRAHYGALLTAAGRWQEAEKELLAAGDVFAPEYPRMQGIIRARLAELRILQGRLEDAGELLRGLDDHPDATFARAALHFTRGETSLAQDVIERALAPADLSDGAEGPLLGLLVDVHLASGAVDEAERAADRMCELGRNQTGPYLKAIAALAKGKVCLASGTGDASACLREALAMFAQTGTPIELARTKYELARAVAADRPEVAIAEATAALEEFARINAARDADAAAAFLRTLGAPARSGPRSKETLTKREAEVLDLLGHGLTNAEIGDRLFISPKTVEHHVGRVLAKLGLRSRTEAAAHAARTSWQR